MRHAAGNMQRTTDDMQRATGDMRQTSSNMQRTTTTCNATSSMQHATRNVQHARCLHKTWRLEKTIVNRQQGNRRHMQHTLRRRRRNQATYATDNVHQTADYMQEDASTCEMQQERHGTAAFRVRRAAGRGQPAASPKHCARQPVRNTAQTPYTRCNIRPVPQHAANTRGTDSSRTPRGCNELLRFNKVDASRRAEKCRSLRAKVEVGVSGCA